MTSDEAPPGEPFDADTPERLAQIGERAPMEESGQIVGRIRKQFAAPEPSEQ